MITLITNKSYPSKMDFHEYINVTFDENVILFPYQHVYPQRNWFIYNIRISNSISPVLVCWFFFFAKNFDLQYRCGSVLKRWDRARIYTSKRYTFIFSQKLINSNDKFFWTYTPCCSWMTFSGCSGRRTRYAIYVSTSQTWGVL